MKATLYHCTTDNHGEQLTVKKRLPTQSDTKEPPTPRLCVCPTVPQCFTARLFWNHDVFVYRTLRATKGVQPFDVWDELITDERWLLPGHRLELATVLPKELVDDITIDIARWHQRTNEKGDFKIRVATLWRACVALPSHTPNRLMRLAERWRSCLDIDPFELFQETKA